MKKIIFLLLIGTLIYLFSADTLKSNNISLKNIANEMLNRTSSVVTNKPAEDEIPDGAEVIKVLFIGNSLISTNNLPKMVHDIARSQGKYLLYKTHAPGGTTFRDHASNANAINKIKSERWDYVVLQEQSLLPALPKKYITKNSVPHSNKLVNIIRKNSPKTEIIFYMTMAHKNGNPQNSHISKQLKTYTGMQKRINESYTRFAKKYKSLIAPVGFAWQMTRKHAPNIQLYRDKNHPNSNGTYLAACVFYSTIFQSKCSGAKTNSRIDSSTAKTLQKISDSVVLSSRVNWDWR